MELMFDFFKELFDPSGFVPRWHCGRWTEAHGWVYILSNINIGLTYLCIPLMLVYFIKQRKDFPFKGVFVLFSLFIVFCGLTHITDAVMFWMPLYRLNTVLLFLTAIVSTASVVALFKVLPLAFAFRSPAELQKIIDEQTAALRLANDRLKASEEQFKALVNLNPDVIVLMGADCRYKFVNNSLETLTHTELDYFIGKSPVEVFPEHPNTKIFTENIEKVLETGKSLHYELDSISEKKGEGYFVVDMVPMHDRNGKVNDVLTITKDFTEIKEKEKQLKDTIEKLDKLSKRLELKRNMLQDFAYIVSHNLRSPISSLVSLIDLYHRSGEPEKKEFMLGKFFEVAKELSNTVQDLSEVVVINQNLELPREEIKFGEVLDRQIKSLAAQIMESNAMVTYDFSGCEAIYYPKVYFESILLNLLTNAIKYSSEKRRPEIFFKSSIDDNGIIKLTCRDNGLGIDMKKYGNKIFSLHKTFHNKPDSRGVGLFITKHQIKSLGGSIFVESEPDKGTTFIIKFNEIEET